MLEQLLRFAPDVARIYMLIRGKRGCSGEQRLDNLLQRDLFCKLRNGDEFPEEVTPQPCSLCLAMQSGLGSNRGVLLSSQLHVRACFTLPDALLSPFEWAVP